MKRLLRIAGYLLGGLSVLALGVLAFMYWRISNPAHDPQPLPPALISAAAPEGAALLQAAAVKADHALLVPVFEPQQKGRGVGWPAR